MAQTGNDAVSNISGSPDLMRGLVVIVIAAITFQSIGAGSVVVPSTGCYALDNNSRIHDFSNFIGQGFEYDDVKEPDLVVRFCKDVETRSQPGYVDFGRYDRFNYFVAGSGDADFIQEYYSGDLMNCENSYDKLGRTAQVRIICGTCPNGQCAGGIGCICKVSYKSTCRVLVDLAIPCVKPGLRLYEGFTVGFHPRSWEIVYNGMTQLGYEKAYSEYSFGTEQREVTLYLTAVASLSNLVRKPMVKIFPEQGLEVRLSGSGAKGNPPTTLSPTMLLVEWRCEKARETPYEVEISIPVERYDSINFTLAKMCEHQQGERGESMKGWAIFGIISCIFIVGFTLFCCGGFIYRARFENSRGLDALPGMSVLSGCLETASGALHGYGGGYTRGPSNANDPFANNQASWDRPPTATQGTTRRPPNERSSYGSI